MKKVVNDIRDLAEVLGLSITTVSRVLNGKIVSVRRHRSGYFRLRGNIIMFPIN
jgi:transcriptional regulator with XRE-family HTH domain